MEQQIKSRFSKNREAILNCLKNTKSHPTAEWIYEQLKSEYPSLSLGTVYRNLNQLKEAGMIKSMGIVSGHEHFDADMSIHYHVICSGCGTIIDLETQPDMLQLVNEIGEKTQFSIAEMQLFGVCKNCSENQEKYNM